MPHRILLAGGVLAAAVSCATSAAAHAVVGNRLFPATIATDDPGVADELSLPTISAFRTGDEPAARDLNLSGEWSKRLTDRLGVSLGETWTRIKTPGAPAAYGFQNLETTLKYQLVKNPEHEALLAAGLSYEWANSGARRVGAEAHSTVTPAIYFGKGFGDLPDSAAWARPFAVTGLVGYGISTRRDEEGRIPRTLSYGVAVEYSLPYLASHVKDLGLPEAINHLTPLVEAAFETPVGHAAGRTTGRINPGMIWSGRRVQLGAEAVIPVNSRSGHGVGWMVQVHFFIDDLFPRSLGRPVW